MHLKRHRVLEIFGADVAGYGHIDHHCVLSHIASDLGIGHVAAGSDRADVQLPPPRQPAGWEPRCGGSRDADGAGVLVDGGSEKGEVGPSGRGVGWPGGAVEPDDGVEVDHAAALVIRPPWRRRPGVARRGPGR
jgi:hypothetical protein